MNSVSTSSEKPDKSSDADRDAANEDTFIQQYTELTGASEAQARSVYMYLDIIRQRDPYCYHFESIAVFGLVSGERFCRTRDFVIAGRLRQR